MHDRGIAIIWIVPIEQVGLLGPRFILTTSVIARTRHAHNYRLSFPQDGLYTDLEEYREPNGVPVMNARGILRSSKYSKAG